jgi:hypothetical protein
MPRCRAERQPKVLDDIEDLYLKRRELEANIRNVESLNERRIEKGRSISPADLMLVPFSKIRLRQPMNRRKALLIRFIYEV